MGRVQSRYSQNLGYSETGIFKSKSTAYEVRIEMALDWE